MKIRIFQAMSEKALENKVNKFISTSNINVKKMDFACTIFYLSVMVTYEE